MRALSGNSDAERQVHLERYLHAWLRAHALTLRDLADQGVRDRLLRALSSDVGAILGRSANLIAGQIGLGAMKLGADLLQKGAAKLLGLGDASAKRGG